MKTQLLVIGAGATGMGIARDAALRGIKTIVVDKGAIGSGTSGYFHGLLHSGARYVTNDADAARECIEENIILKRIAPSAIHETGGLFLAITEEDCNFAPLFYLACKAVGIPAEELSPDMVLAKEPLVNPTLKRVFSVPDGYINGKKMLELNKLSAEKTQTPATFLEHHEVVKFLKKDSRIEAVVVKDESGEKTIECDMVINASGIWASQIGALAGADIQMTADKGAMLVTEEKLSTAVLNRCRPPSDGDILVPTANHSIMGTTSVKTDDINTHVVEQWEIDRLIKEGSVMVPSMATTVISTTYSGVRTLVGSTASTARGVSRSFKLIDHKEEGMDNLISMIGGKFTIYRKMAEVAVDAVCEKLKIESPCATANKVM
ncbi:MAG: Anaerobic glycerol-3-phosphate dehydrogenase subunit A [Microgenomates bacterium OLB22]|nr:MAG: Anaerobic glycerol-3-phosphate dehydrogenase subunit A [Microgenomates bacterium OLB22]